MNNNGQHPLNRLLEVSLENLGKIMASGQVIGQPVSVGEKLVMPVAKITFGFGAAGSDIPQKKKKSKYIDYQSEFGGDGSDEQALFGGGSGGGVTITPCAFIVLSNDDIEIKSVDKKNPALEKVAELIRTYIDAKQRP